MNYTSRLQKLRQRFAKKDIDALFVSQPENRYYLSGFNGSAGYLLITAYTAILATDFRYTEQARNQAPDYEIFEIRGEVGDWFPKLAGRLSLKRLGFETEHVTFAQYRRLSDTLDEDEPAFGLVPVDGTVESLRTIKEPEEIELISRAVEISDSAFEYIEDKIDTGMSELEVAWEIEKFMRDKGSQTVPFDVIVASGPNSALPHAKPSQRIIQAGEPVIIDIGARIQGYSSDLTRTICLGSPGETFTRIYDVVLKAQLAAMAAARAGMTGDEADGSARRVMEQADYGKAFGHGLGHGIGLAPHERPRLGPKSTERLASGMVFTIEPGIYLSGWGGVRIEDVVAMEDDKIRVVSKARKRGSSI